MAKLTKKQKAQQGKVDSTKLYPLTDALAQGGADGRRRVGFASWHLQLDEADNFLGHVLLSLRVQTPWLHSLGSPGG